jgi:hypothetical protein
MIVAKYKEMKFGRNLAESYKEGHGSKRAVLTMMMMYAKARHLRALQCFYQFS